MAGNNLIVKTHAFGDALLATPAVARLIASGGTWSALAGPSSSEVWRRMTGISCVMTAPIPGGGLKGFLRLLAWSASRAASSRRFDRTVVFHASKSMRRWVRMLTAAPSRSGGLEALGKWESVSPLDTGRFAGASYADLAGVEVTDFRPVFRIEDSERRMAADLLGREGFIAVSPGGGRNPRDEVSEKRWSPEGFAEVVALAGSRGLRSVLLGDRFDMPAAARVLALSGSACPLDLTGRTGWGEAAAVMERCMAFVGPDSGLAHLATAAGLKAVVLFGPTDPSSLYHPSLISPVVSGSECSPCYSNEVFPGCRTGRSDCMFRIEAGRVWSTLEKILDEDMRG